MSVTPSEKVLENILLPLNSQWEVVSVDSVEQREVRQHEDLRKTKWLFLKDIANLTDEQYFKFESIRASNYEVSRAWLIKENFSRYFETKHFAGKRITFMSLATIYYACLLEVPKSIFYEFTELTYKNEFRYHIR